MAGLYDDLELAPVTPANAPRLPASQSDLYHGLELAPTATVSPDALSREPKGLVEHIQAGLQGSVLGHLWRQKVPDLVMNDPDASAWWERLATQGTQAVADLPIMIPAGAVGGAKGTAIGGAVAGPPGAIAGGLLVGGAAMFAAPTAIRESLVQYYRTRDGETPADWFNSVRAVAAATMQEAAVGAVTMGAGGVAARTAGRALAPGIGTIFAVPAESGIKTATAGTFGKAVGAADVAAQIAAMTTMPAAMEGHLPEASEFADAAAVILTLKAGGMVVDRAMSSRATQTVVNTYLKTGRTPAEQLAVAQADQKLADEYARPPVDPMTGTTSGVPVKLDRVIAEAEFLARGGVPEAPDIKKIIQEIKDAGPLQGDMVRDFDRIAELGDQARRARLTDPERAELGTLRDRLAALEASGVIPPTTPAEPATFGTEQLAEARTRSAGRLEELKAKPQLTDAERAERVFLTNATPEAMAKHFKLAPVRITMQEREASAQRIYDDVLRQLREADTTRQAAGLQPLGDEHAATVAALVRARVRARAARLGVLPEDLYRDQPLRIVDETQAEVIAAKAAIPPEAPRFTPPEVDIFGEPVPPEVVPRLAVENLAVVEAPLEGLVLSKEVPQFKAAADAEGVVVPLGGKFDRVGVGPIQIWERLDGTREVISGRHRLDLARRSGETTIPAQIHKESEGFDVRQAATLDAQLNIREEQGSIADYAQYFKDAGITEEAAKQLGLLARAKGRTGYALARDASPDLLAAHRAGLLSDEAAFSIAAAAPGSARLQAVGVAMVNEGKSILIAVNTMKAVELMAADRLAAGVQGDIFGFDDSAMREASKMAKLASARQRKIGEQIAAVSGASKRPELAAKMGVNVEDPQAIRAKIVELRQEQELWDNWPMHPELVAILRTTDGTVLKQGPVDTTDAFELAPETPAELDARNREAVEQAARKENAKRQAGLTPEERKAQMDLFNTQGVLFQQERGRQEAEARGSYNIAEKLITLMQNADKSTILHELGHDWLQELKTDAARPDAPEQLKMDWEVLRRELAIGEGPDIPRAAHEQFARGFERYVADGEAPSIELRSVFQKFRAWLIEIYKDLLGLDVKINPEIKAIMDRMIATDEEIAASHELGVPRAYVPEAKETVARKIVPGFKAEQVSMEPYADELPKGPGQAPESHINYAYINSPLDVKLTMQKMAEIDQAAIQKQRGGVEGVKSWEQANAEQAKYVNDILGGTEDTLRILSPRDPAAPGPDVRLGILKKLAVGAAKDSARLRDIVLAQQAGEQESAVSLRQQLEYMGSIERARMIQAEFLGERASVARALNALKDATEGSGEIGRMLDAIGYGEEAAGTLYQTARTPAQEQAFLKAEVDKIMAAYRGRSVFDIARLHKEIGTLKGTFKFAEQETMARSFLSATGQQRWDMLVEGWKSSLLSGPITPVTNVGGTLSFQFMRPAVDALAATIGMARGASVGMGESDRASMSEAVGRLASMISGAQEGLKVFGHALKVDDPTGKVEVFRTAIPGRAGEIIRFPYRLMSAGDALTTTMYYRGEMKSLAIRKAFDENMDPSTREFAERIDYLMDHPTPEMEVTAKQASTRMAFNMPLGEKGLALTMFINKWNLQWMVPFIRTPINIAKEMARMSPLAPIVGEWRADFAKGGVARDRALAEVALGSALMAVTMAGVFNGTITGGADPDPGKRRGKEGVTQNYSGKIGDTLYEYARIQPMGTLMGLAADLAMVWDHATDEEKDKIPKMLAVAFANAVTNQTFLQGITNFVNAMSDPQRFAPRFAQQFAASMVPNIIGQPTAMADPVVREVNGMLDAVCARIPGCRQDMLPKRDWLGEPVQTKERLGVVSPIRTLTPSEDKVRLEAARLDISMAAPPKKTHIGKGTGKIGDVELTPEEQDRFEQVSGDMAHRLLTNIVNAPNYDSLPDLVRRRIFAKVMVAAHRVGAVTAIPPEKRANYLQAITEKMSAELAPIEGTQ